MSKKRIVIFKDFDNWTARILESDLFSEGKTKEQAVERIFQLQKNEEKNCMPATKAADKYFNFFDMGKYNFQLSNNDFEVRIVEGFNSFCIN